jgi:hypothetical protein
MTITYILTEPVFSATDRMEAGTRVELVEMPHHAYADIRDDRSAVIKQVSLKKLRLMGETGR